MERQETGHKSAHQIESVALALTSAKRPRATCGIKILRHHRERKVVAVPSAVTGLEIIAVHIHNLTVCQIAKRAIDRIGAGAHQ